MIANLLYRHSERNGAGDRYLSRQNHYEVSSEAGLLLFVVRHQISCRDTCQSCPYLYAKYVNRNTLSQLFQVVVPKYFGLRFSKYRKQEGRRAYVSSKTPTVAGLIIKLKAKKCVDLLSVF